MILSRSHPCSSSFLERYRVECRRHLRTSLIGTHATRRRGQSLEFYDFAPYTPGDDVRYIDWLASARHPPSVPHDPTSGWLVRRFVAEEKFTLVISIDARPTMTLPEAVPKIQVAAWLAEALAWMALCSDDRVILHSLFGRGRIGMKKLSPSVDRGQIRSVLQTFVDQPSTLKPNLNLAVLEPEMPPTSVWMILTDAYFSTEAANKLARRMTQAQDSMRWVILVDLDSWPHEKAKLLLGEPGTGKEIWYPGLKESRRCMVDATYLAGVQKKIDAHKRLLLRLSPRPEYDDHWVWSEKLPAEKEQFFLDRFVRDPDKIIKRLFMREA